MAIVSNWNPFGVALNIEATAGTIKRISATQFTVVINASWKPYWSGNNTNYGMKVTSGGKTIYIPAYDGDAHSSGNGSLTGTFSISGNGSQTKSISVVFENYKTGPDSSASKTITLSVSVPAWTSYTITYNANGGTGAPGNQTKWRDQNLTISTTKPTRAGYTFKGWSLTQGGSVYYTPGSTCGKNENLTLWAVWQINTYTIKYNANGGTGAPGNQTKTYGVILTISTTKPTRTGYTFKGWSLTQGGGVYYTPGSKCGKDENFTLWAVWEINTYTIKYNANGGSGAPGDQTKTYGVTLKLSSTKPTRSGYNFLGWATSASATSYTYTASGNYTANANITLYAVWSVAYVKPRISSVDFHRINDNGEIDDSGTKLGYSFTCVCDHPIESINLGWTPSTVEGSSTTIAPDSSTSEYSGILDSFTFDSETSYTITLVVTDSGGSNSTSKTLSSAKFIIDILAEGEGVAFGKAAEKSGYADFGYGAIFNGPVMGKALGMDTITRIPAGSDFDTYLEPGCYAVYSDADAQVCKNCPSTYAGRLEVWSSTGSPVRPEKSAYIRQRYIPFRISSHAANNGDDVYDRDITRDVNNTWNFANWIGKWYEAAEYTNTDLSNGTFEAYDSKRQNIPKYRRRGSLVEIRGVLTPVSDITTDFWADNTIFTLPNNYRPADNVYAICQGSSRCIWMLSVKTTGVVAMSRYRDGDNDVVCTPGEWLPFHITYFMW